MLVARKTTYDMFIDTPQLKDLILFRKKFSKVYKTTKAAKEYYYFSKLFKKHLGISPKDYRKQFKLEKV